MDAAEGSKRTLRMARAAGVLYLVVIATGVFNLMYLPSQLTVHGDAAATLERVVHAQRLFRFGILADLLCNTAFLLLPLAFYRLLGSANRRAAWMMVAFAVVQVPIAFVNATHRLDVLWLLDGAYPSPLGPEQVQEQVMLALAAYRHGLFVLEVFWGLWLLPLGYLIIASGQLPRVLGVLLVLGGAGYLADVLATLLLPTYPTWAVADYLTLPASLGEIGTCLWLLVMGARAPASLARPGLA